MYTIKNKEQPFGTSTSTEPSEESSEDFVSGRGIVRGVISLDAGGEQIYTLKRRKHNLFNK